MSAQKALTQFARVMGALSGLVVGKKFGLISGAGRRGNLSGCCHVRGTPSLAVVLRVGSVFVGGCGEGVVS